MSEHGTPAGNTAGGDPLVPEAVAQTVTAEPRRRVGLGFILAFSLAYMSAWMAYLTPPFVAMAVKVRQIDPAGSAGSLAFVLGVGGLFAIVAYPIFGKLSDRTPSRFGMRRPWIAGGWLVGTIGLLLCGMGQSIHVVLLGWIIAQLGLSALLATLVALLPDHVPMSQRGLVSGFLGMGIPVGAIGGTFIAQSVSGTIPLMFLLPAGVAFVCIAILFSILEDRRLGLEQVRTLPRYGLREFLDSFWVNPRRHPDFGWAWLSRFLVFMGVDTLVTYQAFYLINHLGLDPEKVAQFVFLGTLVHYGALVLVSVVGGWLSDRLGRRKVFVMSAAALYGIGLAFIAFAPSFEVFLIGMAITGLAEGIYSAVDLALVADVLPHPDNVAKDLGVFQITSSLPQSLAPAVAPIFLSIPLSGGGQPGGNYTALFAIAALLAFLGALAVRPIRGVR
ncbi:MFS transporter [Rubrobacter calidifluminis]|uniref:MFS transporter n=1 Tax=Rubrobacter calidifluminis TaxID=1392640 RepID=UPI0023629BE1|nr:MFS transporter [Rubrobacter calidifluminis]